MVASKRKRAKKKFYWIYCRTQALFLPHSYTRPVFYPSNPFWRPTFGSQEYFLPGNTGGSSSLRIRGFNETVEHFCFPFLPSGLGKSQVHPFFSPLDLLAVAAPGDEYVGGGVVSVVSRRKGPRRLPSVSPVRKEPLGPAVVKSSACLRSSPHRPPPSALACRCVPPLLLLRISVVTRLPASAVFRAALDT